MERALTAHGEYREAQERLVTALAEAVAAGVPQVTLASALGVSRVTLWRWLSDQNRPR